MSDLFNEEIISQATHTKWAGKTVHFARETDSTNLWGKRAWREEGAGHGVVCGRISVRRTRTFYKTMECAAGQCHYYEYPYLPGIFSAEGADADTCYGTFSCTGSSRARS